MPNGQRVVNYQWQDTQLADGIVYSGTVLYLSIAIHQASEWSVNNVSTIFLRMSSDNDIKIFVNLAY